MSKLTDFLTGGSDEPKEIEGEEEFYTTTKEEFHHANGMAGSKMMLLEPRAYSESQQIADYLKARNQVVVNFKRVTSDVSKRIMDFLNGIIYAIDGTMQKLGPGIVLCAPKGFEIEGNISEDDNKKGNKKDNQDW